MASTPTTVLITGAAGRIGTMLRERLPAHGYRLRLTDARPVPGAPDAVIADLRDPEAVRAAVEGVDAVVHLGGIATEDRFENILATNIEGTHHLYEAARSAGVRRVVFASSNHAVGYVPRPGDPGALVAADTPARPDSYYGVSKGFGEALASLYADRHGIETVSLRIGSCFPRPTRLRHLATWLSPDDCARLVHAALAAPEVGHTVVFGISANTRAWWDLGPARALGYHPQDDAEHYAAELLATHGAPDPTGEEHRLLGGVVPLPPDADPAD